MPPVAETRRDGSYPQSKRRADIITAHGITVFRQQGMPDSVQEWSHFMSQAKVPTFHRWLTIQLCWASALLVGATIAYDRVSGIALADEDPAPAAADDVQGFEE